MTRTVLALVALVCCLVSPGYAAYGYYRSVTIDHTKVPNTNQTNFPVLVSVTDAALIKALPGGGGGHVRNTNGYDIGFYSNSNLTSALFWEMERYNALTGEVVAWVMLPTVSHTTDTVFYVGYGDAGISTFQSTVTGVWSASYKGVWHLANGTTLSPIDSTVNANDGMANSATAVVGQIDGAAGFNGTNANIGINSSASLNVSGAAMTVEAWVKRSAFDSVGSIFDNGVTGVGGVAFAIGVMPATTNQMKLTKYAVADVTVSGVPADTNWHHLVAIWGVLTTVPVTALYVDGTQSGSGDGNPFDIASNGNAHACIGCDATVITHFAGNIDEVRVSNVVRAADWIATEYNNQSNPSTFLTLGAEIPFVSANKQPRRFIF